MNTRRRDRLWLAVRFPTLPLTAAATLRSCPQAVADQHHIVCANQAALINGIYPGQDLTTARLLGNCELIHRDPQREESALLELEIELYRFTPHIERHHAQDQAAHGFLLEISTCLTLFDGCKELVTQVSEVLWTYSHQFVLGLGHTAGAAWLLSRKPRSLNYEATRDQFIIQLKELPISALNSQEQSNQLQKMGFATLGDIASQIERTRVESLRKRLGSQFADYLSELFGIEGDFGQRSLFEKPLPTVIPREEFNEGIQFDAPIASFEYLKLPMEMLLQKAEDYLRRRQLECPCIDWQLSDIEGRRETISVEADRPQMGWQLFYDLTVILFDHRELPFEVDSIQLCCRREAPVQNRDQPLKLSSSTQTLEVDFERTAAKLRARVGDANVYKLSYGDAFLPEQTHLQISLAARADQVLPPVHQVAVRPSWLFTKPESVGIRSGRLYWRGYLELIAGPERMCGSWWEKTEARDYFIAKRNDALHVWIYRDLQEKAWYVHGIFT